MDVENPSLPPDPRPLTPALKEWAVAVRALREGRQILLLRKGGIRDAGGEFSVQARRVLLMPTYLHEDEQAGSLQPCYGQWLKEETERKPKGEQIRFEAWADITDVLLVQNPQVLFTFPMQHIYSEKFLKFRVENEPHKPLYALFLRTYELPQPVLVPSEMDYYGCKSWIDLNEAVDISGSKPVMSDRTYNERARVTRRILTETNGAHPLLISSSQPKPKASTGG